MGKTCVCGAEELDVDVAAKLARVGDVTVLEGDVISIDGSTGEVFLGEVPVKPSPVVAYLEHGLDAAVADADEETAHARALGRPAARATPTRPAGCACAPTPTPPRTPPAPATSARRASA